MNDLKFAFRQLLKNPGFTAVAVLTLALSIGATTAIVSVVRTTVFDPLPSSHPERLVEFGYGSKSAPGWRGGVNPPLLRSLHGETNLFERVAAYSWDIMTLDGEIFPETVRGAWVTPEFFTFWSEKPELGRIFAEDEGHPARNDVIVISHRLWQRRFDGDPGIVGRGIPFRERPMTVIGVMPPSFSFPEPDIDFWRPVEGPDPDTDEYLPNFKVIGQMQPGVGMGQAQAFLDVETQRQEESFTMGQFQWAFQARDLSEMFSTPESRRSLGLLLAAIVFVLLIAAANIANLQLARTETRQQELAVRAALGAGRGRVFRQLFTESLLLAGFGGVVGLSVAVLGLNFMELFIPTDLPRLKPIALDAWVLGLASGVTLVTGLLFGFAPAWIGRRSSLSGVLKIGAVTTTRDRGRSWFGRSLIAGQVALVFVLLTGAGLMVRSVVGLLRVNPGLDPEHLVRVYPSTLGLQRLHYSPDPALNRSVETAFAFFEDSRRRVEALPGVISAGVGFEGRPAEAWTTQGSSAIQMMKYWIGVEEADPLRVMRVSLKRGRWLDRGDAVKGVHRVLVNETAARRLWPGEEVVGKRFLRKERTGEISYEVVGVVGDTLDYSKSVEPRPTLYRANVNESDISSSPKYLVVRTASDPRMFYKSINQELKAAGADPRMPEFINLGEALRTRMAGHRMVMLGLIVFGSVGLALAAIGLYGVLSFSVARRTREIGIRMALGAGMRDVRRIVLGQCFMLVMIGGVIGVVSALVTGRVLRAYLYEVTGDDPAAFAGAMLLLCLVALFACWLPARRAAGINPMEALRRE